jgi:hypothetical protein
MEKNAPFYLGQRRISLWLMLLLGSLALCGCVSGPGASGDLGYGQERRVVIVGEKVSPEIALYYQRRYDSEVWYTPPESKDSADVFFKVGPTRAMRSLISELKSINHTLRPWEIIVAGVAEAYFLTALKYMDTGALAHARGDIVLIDSKSNKDIEVQVARVTNGSFFVTYEFQKY